jgi:ribonuclease G
MTTRAEGGTGDEILINATPRETRVAVVENGVLQEILIERAGKRGLVGNIYKGRYAGSCPAWKRLSWISAWSGPHFLHVSDIRLEILGPSETEVTHRDRRPGARRLPTWCARTRRWWCR